VRRSVGGFKTAGLYLFASVSVLFSLCKIAGLNDWSWWRVWLPIGGYAGFNLTYMATGFAYLSWIHFVDGNEIIATASIADDEKRSYLNLGAIQFALLASGVSERVSPSVALSGFWNSFASAGVMTALGSLRSSIWSCIGQRMFNVMANRIARQGTHLADELFDQTGTEVIRLPPLSPNLNAFAERFVRSIKEECLTKMIFIGQGSLRRALTEYMTHFHEERNHQGLENRLIRERPVVAANDASIHRRTRLGGMLSYYYRVAA